MTTPHSAETPDQTPDVSALLPCPFCGETPTLAKWCGDWGFAHSNNGCLLTADLYQFDAEAEAITAWNTRPTPTPADQGDLVERAVMISQGCGLTIDGKHVLCCDPCVQGHNDAYGKPLYDAECSCRSSARAAIAAMPEAGEVEQLNGALSAYKAICEHRNQQNETLRTQLAGRDETIAGMRTLLRWVHDTLIEINPSNYDHDDVCELNNAVVEVILGIAPALGETHGKTAEKALTPQVPHG